MDLRLRKALLSAIKIASSWCALIGDDYNRAHERSVG
jgi:hypothetical protein